MYFTIINNMTAILFFILLLAFAAFITYNPIIKKYSDGHYYLEYLSFDGVWKVIKLF